MNPIRWLFPIALIAAPLGAATPVVSLVQNSGFEDTTALNDWSTAGAAMASVVSSPTHRGTNAAEIVVATPETDGLEQSLLGQMSPGRSYLISGWVRLAASQPNARLSLHLVRTSNGIVHAADGVVSEEICDAGAGWHYLRGVYQLPAHGSLDALELLATSDDAAVTFDLDDVTILPLQVGIYNAPAATLSGLNAEGVRMLLGIYDIEDGLGARTNPGNWVLAPETVGSMNHVMSQTSPYFFSTAYAGSTGWADNTLAVDVRFDTLNPTGAVTLKTCLQTDGTCYMTVLNGSTLTLSKSYPGGTQRLGQVSCAQAVGVLATYTIAVDHTAGTVVVARNGTNLLTVSDASVPNGRIALETFRCSASFDNVTVTTLSGGSTLYADDFETGGAWTSVVNPTPFSSLIANGSAGIPLMVTFTAKDPRHRNGAYIRVPTATTTPSASTVLSDLDQFLTLYGSYISIVAVEAEPNYQYSTSDRTLTGGAAPALTWMQSVAAQVQSTIAAHPATLGQLRVCTGSMDSLVDAYQDTPEAGGLTYRSTVPGLFLTAMLNWANTDSNVDFVDVDAHEASTLNLEQALAYLIGQCQKPILAAEWSDAPAAQTWLTQTLDATFRSQSGMPPGVLTSSTTNAGYITDCYSYPVAKSEWDAFVAMSPLTEGYLQAATDIYQEQGLVLGNYGAYNQYGDPSFDMKQLYAQMTVQLSGTNTTQASATYPTSYAAISRVRPAPADQIAFDGFDAGAGAWSTTNGSWTVTTGADPAYEQTDTAHVAYAVEGSTALQDGRVIAEVTPQTFASGGNSVGLVARFTGTGTYYAALYRNVNHTLVIQRKSAGVQTDLVSTSFTLTTGTTYQFEFDVQGNNLQFRVNDALKLQTTDGTLTAGQVGLITYDTDATFDNVDLRAGRYADDFETGSAADWTASGGTWTVQSAATEEYDQSNSSGAAFSGLMGLDWTDYTVQADVTPETMVGSGSDAIGLLARYTDSSNYYAFVYDDVSHRMELVRDVAGTSTTLRSVPVVLTVGATTTLKLEVTGTTLRGYVDGKLVISEVDSGLTTGAPGVTTSDATGYFDNVSVIQE
ncbi:MAG TPA: carbohydrate binding domain-containing protein [Opitutaceae bacterium]|nr:carbohydrate binding domain-containing protein [Opitutaceae bacterium]